MNIFIFPRAHAQTYESAQSAAPITSIYMDETKHGFPYYHRRIAREEGALLFRLRWYARRGLMGSWWGLDG